MNAGELISLSYTGFSWHSAQFLSESAIRDFPRQRISLDTSEERYLSKFQSFRWSSSDRPDCLACASRSRLWFGPECRTQSLEEANPVNCSSLSSQMQGF